MPDSPSADPDDRQGLAFCDVAASDAAPRYLESDIIAPTRSIGLGAKTTLKATFWHATIEETAQLGDLDFASVALNTGGGRVWRNDEATPTDVGAIAMQPFEGARWRFEHPVSFVHLYVPFTLLGAVCESLFDRELAHAEVRMPSGIRDDRLCNAARTVQYGLASIEPTNLILDSWALILSDILVRRFSSHAGRPVRTSFGKIPARGVAHVIDYIEANIDRDLDLASLAGVAAMSVYHFARRFKETVGMSPHAYVLSRRIRRAREMLDRGGTSLAHVAAACGFSSQAHFTTAFQRDLGATPGEYRRAMQTGAPASAMGR
ncbi:MULTISPECIES: AraC family transcriptional regulator [Rhodomicrobium]|uniref:AraC family transcriptional regulator n=1 Tax=Rhodomicrobium TaxID=1068 RepID=UPI001482D5ED|nr:MULTISPECIES: AraC family transcriptional regulator [Rhodomicrobium]